MLLQEFKRDLPIHDNAYIIGRYLTTGTSPILDDDKFFSLRDEVAKHLELHHTDIHLVGSAKLGFSLKPQVLYRLFRDSSDIDLAIVSVSLFEEIWKEVSAYEDSGGWWPHSKEFKGYHFRGWIRPDLLPSSRTFNRGNDWFEFFRRLTASGSYGPHKISAGLYHSHFFLEQYQSKCISVCREALRGEDAKE